MNGVLQKAIVALIIVTAVICAWSVLTKNHLFVG